MKKISHWFWVSNITGSMIVLNAANSLLAIGLNDLTVIIAGAFFGVGLSFWLIGEKNEY